MMRKRPRLLISATHKSSGKTTFSLGLLAHLTNMGLKVRAFKKGPDYIDPMWLKQASGKECYNLDPYLMGTQACLETFLSHSEQDQYSIIEGNHGLHDGLSLDGSDSSAGLAEILDAPVLLILDSRGMNRGAAAVVLGMQKMNPRVNIAGVVLNRTRSKRQEDKQRLAIEKLCRVPVLGVLRDETALTIKERHLGLTTVGESRQVSQLVEDTADLVSACCDMNAILDLFHSPPPLAEVSESFFLNQKAFPKEKIRNRSGDHREKAPIRNEFKIGVFSDPAFCFYYPDNLEALKRMGAELVIIDSLQDQTLPDVDGLYLGGGFPESFLPELGANQSLMRELKERVKSGIPLYAECGGLIYLFEKTEYQDRTYDLSGVLPGTIGFRKRPFGKGYIQLESSSQTPWFNKGQEIKAHEFHYSKPIGLPEEQSCQFRVLRGFGIDGARDGMLQDNILASYAHIHARATPQWAQSFAHLAREYQGEIR